MKRITRWAVALLGVTLCLCVLPGCAAWTFVSELFSGHAESSAESTPAASDVSLDTVPSVTVMVGSASGQKGDTLLIPVIITEKSNLVNADVYLRYDPKRLRAIKQYDADTDQSRWTMSGIWDGSLWAEEPTPGTMHVMLASGGDGLAAGGALFQVMFEVLTDLDTPALIQPTVAVCGVAGEDGHDVGAVAQGLVAVSDGQVTAPPDTSENS